MTTPPRPLRFGLAGTGHWARITHAAAGFDMYVWGEPGRSAAPGEEEDAQSALRTALTELADNARSGQLSHACDVQFGRAVGRVLAEAQRQVDARRAS